MQENKNKQNPPQDGKNEGKNNPGHQHPGDKHQTDKKDTHKTNRQEGARNSDEEPETESDFVPDKRTEIDDDPENTKKKIPNMKK